MQRDAGRCREMQGDAGRCREIPSYSSPEPTPTPQGGPVLAASLVPAGRPLALVHVAARELEPTLARALIVYL